MAYNPLTMVTAARYSLPKDEKQRARVAVQLFIAEAKVCMGGKRKAEDITREPDGLGRGGQDLTSLIGLNMMDGMSQPVVAVLTW